jgi:hypothetical protein
MTAEDIIREVQNNASEYMQEVKEPRDLLVAILANKLSAALDHIQYLEKRLQHVSRHF